MITVQFANNLIPVVDSCLSGTRKPSYR